MIFKVSDISRDIRVCIDMNRNNACLLDSGDTETLTIDEIIVQKIPEAVRTAHTEAPTYLLESGHNFGDSVFWGDKESGYVLLPDDFMRLLVFKMSDWDRAVYTAISTEDEDYEKMRSRYKGIRGTCQKPVCVIAVRPEGKVLEFYSCKSEDAQVSQGSYLPYPAIDGSGGIDICERCYTAVIYIAAALVMNTYGEIQKATSFFDLAKSALR